jgi:hypothetical protein
MSERLYEKPKRAGGEKRGSSADRRTRKSWMLSEKSGFGGDGVKVPCVHCGAVVDFGGVEADRKTPGGSYRRENIQPACHNCNHERSNNTEWVSPLNNHQFPGG